MSTLAQHSEIYNLAWQRFLLLVKGRQVNAGNIIVFVSLAMEIANEYDDMQGFEKKELVIELITNLVMTVQMDPEDKEILQKYLSTTLERTIDILIAAANGKLGLGPDGQPTAGCFGCFGQKTVTKSKAKGKKRKQLRRQALRSTSVDDLVDIIYQQTKKAIVNKKIGPSNIIILVTITMQFIEQYPQLQGFEKKEICMQVIQKLIVEIPMSDDDRALVQLLVQTTLPRTIDAIVFAANGALNLAGFSGCCPIFASKPQPPSTTPSIPTTPSPEPQPDVIAEEHVCPCSPDCKCGTDCKCETDGACVDGCH